MVGRTHRAYLSVVFGERLTCAKDLCFGRHLVGGGDEGLAVAFGLNPDSAVDSRASFVGVEDAQFTFADAVKDAVDHSAFFVVDVCVKAFDKTIVSELGRSECRGCRTSAGDAFRVQVRPVGEVEDRGVHGFFLLLVVAVIT